MAARLFPGVFISTEQLQQVLGRVRLLDVRYSLVAPLTHGAEQHLKHRPAGSIFIDVEKQLCGATHGTTARHPLPEAGVFGAAMAALGVGAAPCVCFDDTAGGLAAARCWWMLDNLGVEAYLLNGGWQAYAAAGLPQESGAPVPESAAPPLDAWPGRTAWSGTVTHADLAAAPRLVDARTADRFGSTVRGLALDPLAGHVPGAVNRPWVQNVEPVPGAPAGTNRLKPVAALKTEMEAALGGVPAKDAVFMCASGVTTCMNLARHVGLGVGRIYPGSWSEYCGIHRGEVLGAQLAATERAVAMRKPIMAAPLVDAACKFTVDGAECPSLEAAAAVVPKFADLLPLLKRGEEAECFTQEKGVDTPAHVVVAHP